MPRHRDPALLRRSAAHVRCRWEALSSWRARQDGSPPRVHFGRVPIRIAICDPAVAVEPRSDQNPAEARAQLAAAVLRWPQADPRLAVEGGTGLGKTTAAVSRCADHVVGPRLVPGQLFFVAHDRRRVAEVLALVRAEVARRDADPQLVADLLGRAPASDDEAVRFGCRDHARADRYGRRGRRVDEEVCGACSHTAWCKSSGYVRHSRDAEGALVVVTTAAKLRGLSQAQWDAVGAVLCDEDVLPGLLHSVSVRRGSLTRALRYVERKGQRLRPGREASAILRLRPLVEAMVVALSGCERGSSTSLVDLLPEACDRFHSEEGHRDLLAAMPRSWRVSAGGSKVPFPDPHAPAPFERDRRGRAPRQVWGRLLDALVADLRAGDSRRCATVRVERGGAHDAPSVLTIHRVDDRTLDMLRARPLLALDATMHPAAAVVLAAEHLRIDYDQGRSIVQVLGPLLRAQDLTVRTPTGRTLSDLGRRLVAKLAAWLAGRHGYVLVRKSLRPLLEAESSRYAEMKRVELVSPGRERGWDASAQAVVFADVGRHAKPHPACEAEARALRSWMRRRLGSTALLDGLETPASPQRFVGRGRPVRYRGELVERVARRSDDGLAALIQDAHRVATVRQFIGRDRSGRAEVLLLRGDPTVGADALVALEDLADAVPLDRCRLAGGRTVP